MTGNQCCLQTTSVLGKKHFTTKFQDMGEFMYWLDKILQIQRNLSLASVILICLKIQKIGNTQVSSKYKKPPAHLTSTQTDVNTELLENSDLLESSTDAAKGGSLWLTLYIASSMVQWCTGYMWYLSSFNEVVKPYPQAASPQALNGRAWGIWLIVG